MRGLYAFASAACGYTAYLLGVAAYHYRHPIPAVLAAGCGTGSVLLGRQALKAQSTENV